MDSPAQLSNLQASFMKVATKIKLELVAIALLSWAGWCYLYEKFVSAGNKAVNATHSVLVNDHGTVVYITTTQEHVLTLVTATAVASFMCAVVADLYERSRRKLL